MQLIHVAAGSLNQTPMDWERNLNNILEAIRIAKEKSVSILCLPELCITGYGCEDMFHAPGVHENAIEMLREIALHTKGIIVSVGLPVLYAGGAFNAVGLLVDGKIVGFVAKQHLAGDGIHYERRWFHPWPRGVQGVFEIEGVEYPIGDLLFNVGGVKISFEICEDAWVGLRPGANHAARGADIILNPSASHFAFGKHAVRRRFVTEGSRAFNVAYVYANLVGNESGRAIYDGDNLIAADGKLLAAGTRLSFQNCHVTSYQIDIDKTRLSRARTSSFEPDVDGDESDVFQIEFDFDFGQQKLQVSDDIEPKWQSSDELKFEEFTRAVALGLIDYMCKSRSRGFVISLSGGADSAAAAVLVSLAVKLAVQDLGLEEFKLRLGDWATTLNSTEELTKELLTTVYQKTRNSSKTTQNAALKVAEGVGARHLVLDVDDLVEGYKSAVASELELELNWDQHDTALQNIQARTRAPSVWMIANIRNALLLATSNRSESAVGYATMDGDTCGGLSPLSGIDKAFLREWLVWIETAGPDGFSNCPDMKYVNNQDPTAELRPQESGQTDEDDLMPYDVLDFVEGLAIRDKMMPVDVFKHLQSRYSKTSSEQLKNWTVKFFRLWCRNQWKRERYAPGFHLDDKSLDPKTWCRFPILSGGYTYELAKLEKYFESLGNDS